MWHACPSLNRTQLIPNLNIVIWYEINISYIILLTSCLWLNAKIFICWISEMAKLVHLLSESYHFIWMSLLASETMLLYLSILYFCPFNFAKLITMREPVFFNVVLKTMFFVWKVIDLRSGWGFYRYLKLNVLYCHFYLKNIIIHKREI